MDERIRHKLTIPKTPKQNSVAEQMNLTLVETVRSMLIDLKLPKKFWAECLLTAVYLRNRSPTKAVLEMTPFEAWYGHKPDVSHLRVFGCLVYAHIEKDERSKLDSKARKCILLGYGTETKGYQLYDVDRERILYSRNVVFEENKMGIGKEEISETEQSIEIEECSSSSEEEERNHPNTDTAELEPEVTVRRSTREKHRPDFYGVWVHSAEDVNREPVTVSQALSGSESQEWREAMEIEMNSMYKNDVWELVPLPEGRQVQWVQVDI